MTIYLGADHGGLQLKERLEHELGQDFTLVDCGTYDTTSTDYSDYALAVCRQVRTFTASRGILICRSGEGMVMAANKIPGIRAALVWSPEVAVETRRDNDANVLVLAADFLTVEKAEEITKRFLETPFSGEERHVRRLHKLEQLEQFAYRLARENQ
jgi:ribose 5-phosphate isomerase B